MSTMEQALRDEIASLKAEINLDDSYRAAGWRNRILRHRARLAALTAALPAPGVEALHRAEALCTAWQGVFLGLEAHLMDRVAMKDEADPARYLSILRSMVADVNRDSAQIVASRWHDASVARQRIDELEAAAPSAPAEISQAQAQAMREALRSAKGQIEHHLSGPYGTCSDGMVLAEIVAALTPEPPR